MGLGGWASVFQVSVSEHLLYEKEKFDAVVWFRTITIPIKCILWSWWESCNLDAVLEGAELIPIVNAGWPPPWPLLWWQAWSYLPLRVPPQRSWNRDELCWPWQLTVLRSISDELITVVMVIRLLTAGVMGGRVHSNPILGLPPEDRPLPGLPRSQSPLLWLCLFPPGQERACVLRRGRTHGSAAWLWLLPVPGPFHGFWEDLWCEMWSGHL